MQGTFEKPAAAAGEVTATELQQRIFNAPPSAEFAARTAAALAAPAAPQMLKPPPGLARDTDMEDARSPVTSVVGEKRKREEEEEEESESDVAMEEDTDED